MGGKWPRGEGIGYSIYGEISIIDNLWVWIELVLDLDKGGDDVRIKYYI